MALMFLLTFENDGVIAQWASKGETEVLRFALGAFIEGGFGPRLPELTGARAWAARTLGAFPPLPAPAPYPADVASWLNTLTDDQIKALHHTMKATAPSYTKRFAVSQVPLLPRRNRDVPEGV